MQLTFESMFVCIYDVWAYVKNHTIGMETENIEKNTSTLLLSETRCVDCVVYLNDFILIMDTKNALYWCLCTNI